MTLMDVSDISQMLASRIDELVCTLLPNAVREGHEWRIGSIAGDKGRSMAIHRGGVRCGVWSDFSDSGRGGDALDLVTQVSFGGNKKDAIEWARRWLGISDLNPEAMKQVRVQVRKQAQSADAKAIKQAEQRSKYAQAIWLNASDRLCGTPVDAYLSIERGIPLAELARVPGAIRFASSLEHKDYETGEVTKWPAMVSAIIDKDGRHIATHRTFLKVHADGHVTKAPVKDAKLTIGSYRGGHIPLLRGDSDKSLKSAPEGDKVVICEGIEDGLSIGFMTPEYRVLAAISVNNFTNIWLPPSISEVIIARDNDPDWIEVEGQRKQHPARIAVEAAIGKFQEEGRIVRVAQSSVGKDFNDMLKADRSRTQVQARGIV